MAPVIEPDPDLRVAESGLGATLRAKAQWLNDLADQIGKTTQRVDTASAGVTIDHILGGLDELRKRLGEGADEAWGAARLCDRLAAAAARYRSDAPTVEEILAAWALVEQTRAAKGAAEQRGGSYAAEGRAWQRAKDHLVDLQRRRTDAIAAYKADAAAAAADYQVAGGDRKVGRTSPTPTPKPDAPAPAPKTAPPPSAPDAPAPTPPSVVMPQLSPTSPPAPETVTSSNGGGSGLDPNKLLTAMALQQAMQPQPQQTAPQPQPQMAPQMFQPQPPQSTTKPAGDEERRGPLTLDDIAQMVADAAPGAAVVGGLPLGANGLGPTPATVPAATPGIVPAPQPTLQPATQWNLAGQAPVNPVVTGTSVSGLQTDNNVTGRADNVAAHTAYTPAGTATATGSHLAGTQAGGAAAGSAGSAGTATGAAPGMGAPMVPPMMMGPGGGGNGDPKREPVTAQPGSDSYELSGGPTIDAAVPGGTIAQNRGDAA